MARKARRHSNTGIYHVMLRGINRQDLFHEESDYLFFLERLHLLAHPKNEKNEPASPLCDIYAYCLMTNHVHVMLATKEKELSDVVKPLAISYARYYNTKYSRCGYLFQDRFKSEPVDDLCRLVGESVDDDCSPLEKVAQPTDLEVTEMLLEECHGMPIERISSLPKQDRDKILISVLQKGAGIRQLSKLSAVGFSIIRRLKNISISPSP